MFTKKVEIGTQFFELRKTDAYIKPQLFMKFVITNRNRLIFDANYDSIFAFFLFFEKDSNGRKGQVANYKQQWGEIFYKFSSKFL